MKSVLIVTEQFTLGGLETHISGEIKQLSEQGLSVHLAVGTAFEETFLPPCVSSVASGIPFEPSASAGDLLTAIDRLRNVIRQYSIDAVHVHPFTSIIPAVAAAELEGIPFAITFHGPGSLSSFGPTYDFLLKEVILPSAPLIVSVSPEVSRLLSSYLDLEAICYIPNSVHFGNSEKDMPDCEENDSRWLAVSRLDELKTPGILDFCVKAEKLGISEVLIVGEGPAKSDLALALTINGLSNFVTLAGARADVSQLMKQSCGVAGMGRVVLEAIAAKKPTVLVGYDGVKGVIDKPFLKTASESNFSGRGLPTINLEEFSEQLRVKSNPNTIFENHQFAKSEFNELKSWRLFKEKLLAAGIGKPTAITGLYHSLVDIQINADAPYLQNTEIAERLAEVVCSDNYHDPRLVSSLRLYRHQVEATQQSQSALAESDVQIVNLKQEVAERGGEVANCEQSLVGEQQKHKKNMNSNSLKKAMTFCTAKEKIRTIYALSRTFLNVLSSQGPRMALIETKNWMLKQRARVQNNVQDLKMSNQEVYLMNRLAQSEYIANYIENGLDRDHLTPLAGVFFDGVSSERKILILPLSYPLELTQRPDHIIRFFSDRGYLCIMLQVDNKPLFFREVAENRYLTNVFAGVISSLVNREDVLLYITYPFFGYLLEHMPLAQCLYDVLDDLSVFSLNCAAMSEDHQKLLKRASAVMFSSRELMEKNSHYSNEDVFLVKNGVWVKDFQNFENCNDKLDFGKNLLVVGYHGAISELLDWALLEKISVIPDVKIVMIGPLVEFESYSEQALAVRNRVLSNASVLHIPSVPYGELKHYLKKFSLGLVPFVINEKTNPVLPLKLFEYMAVGLPVCATRTSTLLEYGDSIYVGSSDGICAKIRQMANSTTNLLRIEYKAVLEDSDWARQIAPVANVIDSKFASQKDVGCEISRKVDIININFFDWDGLVLYKGGAERYVFDLACLMRDLGWSPRIIQNANHGFYRDFRGIPVVGVKTDSGGDIKSMSKKFREVCKDSDLVIASPADLACGLFGLKVIGINHGIYWDHKLKRLENSNLAEYRNIFDALRLAARVVAVDTNFINWTRTYDYSMAEKLTYLPNYFDSKVFRPCDKEFDEKIRVLYPRRLYEARGIFITLKAFDYLFSRFPEVELHLVGQANEEDGKIVSEFIESHRDRVIWEEFDMDDMHAVYQKSHIVLVPTLYAEGTSLSCIEAMATNNALVATNIGGLPNLIIDGFNGFLISPTANDLVAAIESLLNDRGLMKNMASRGLEMSKIFEKGNWLARWRKVIVEVVR